jgi:hypothetical protein
MGRDHIEDLGVDGNIILKLIFKRWDGSAVWIDLAEDRAVVNAVLNRRVS